MFEKYTLWLNQIEISNQNHQDNLKKINFMYNFYVKKIVFKVTPYICMLFHMVLI